MDNGFARFDHVRIPKENMLSKFAQVTDDGKYIQPPHAKLSYGGVRVPFPTLHESWTDLESRCCTFAQSKLPIFDVKLFRQC